MIPVSFKGNLYVQLIKRLLVIYLLFTLCRLVFFWFNYDFYKDRTFSQLLTIFAGGLRFDTTAILYTNILFILMYILPFRFRYNRYYQATAKYVYFITNGIALAANCADIVYFRFTMRRTTFDVFKEFEGNTNIGRVFLDSFVDYWYILLFWIVLIFLMVIMYGKPLSDTYVRLKKAVPYYLSATGAFVVSILIIIIGLRGGVSFELRPINHGNAGEYASKPIDVPLILNTPFSIYKTVDRKGIQLLRYFTDEQEMKAFYNPLFVPQPSGAFTNENVMIIYLESFGREISGLLNPHLENGQYKGHIPFLDSLMSNGRFFMRAYASGKKSVDVMPSTLCGIPSIADPFVLSGYYNNKIYSLPHLLKEKGYESAFFCGHPNGSMGYTHFCKLIGFDHYFGMTEYGNDDDFDGNWGIWDEEFFLFTAQKMNELKKPFLATLFSVTSHSPFPIPEKHKQRFSSEKEPYYRAVRYTDYSLQRFFEAISKEPWYENTLFVITADHAIPGTHDEYKTSAGSFAVPILFYRPDNSLQYQDFQVAQHTDVMPTVLSYLNYEKTLISLGVDLTRSENNFAVNYFGNSYQILKDKYILIFDGQKSVALYDLENDVMQQKNLIGELPDVVFEMEHNLKAFLQQYTERMIENKLTLEENDQLQ